MKQLPAQRAYRIALTVLYVLVLLYALAAGLRTVADPDMGWHLATGRWVVQHHAVPSTDVLSFTTPGRPWIYPPFAGVLMYLIFTLSGYAGLSVFCALACVGTVAYLTRRRDLASLCMAMFAVDAIALRTGPRADLFSTVFLALLFGELWAFHRGWSQRLWLLPVIMFLWVNLHPGFLLGLAIIAAYLLLEACDLPFAARRAAVGQRLRRAAPWLAASILVTFINPWGPKLHSAALAIAGFGGQQQQGSFNSGAMILELLPVRFSSHMLRQMIDLRDAENGWVWLMAIAVVVIIIALGRKQVGAAVIQAAALYFAAEHQRYIGLFCVVTVIVGGSVLSEIAQAGAAVSGQRAGIPEHMPLVVPAALATAFVCLVAGVTALRGADFISNRTHVVKTTGESFGVGEAHWLPERAASFIRREQLPGNIFEEYDVGGFAAWRLGPEYPDFIDGRFGAMLGQQQKMLSSPPDSELWQSAADQWQLNVLLLSEGGGRALDRLYTTDFCRSANWRPIYMDEVSLVLLRNTPGNRPWIDRLQVDCFKQPLVAPHGASRKQLYDFWSDAGTLYFALERDSESEEALQHAAALYPEDPFVRMALGRLYYEHQLYPKAEQQFRASLALGENSGTWFALGRVLMDEGRLAEAEEAISNSAELNPTPHETYLQLAVIDIRLQRPDAALRALNEAESTSLYRGSESYAPNLYARIAEGRAEAERMLSHMPQAIAYQQEAVRLTPRNAARWTRLADLLASAGQLDAAQQARQRSSQLQGGTAQP